MVRPQSIPLYALLIYTVLHCCPISHAASKITQTEDAVEIKLDEYVELSFRLHDGMLFGLNRAAVDGVELKSNQTVLMPLLSQEWKDFHEGGRRIMPFLRFESVTADGGTVTIRAAVLGTREEAVYRAFFVYGPDWEAARTNLPPELAAMKAEAERGRALLAAAVANVPKVIKRQEAVDKIEREFAKLDTTDHAIAGGKAFKLNRAQERVASEARKHWASVAAEDAELKQALEAVRAYDSAIKARAIEIGAIHRDYYRFPHLRIPSEVTDIEYLRRLHDAHGDALEELGTIEWVISPDRRNVAGWEWRGWKQHYRFELKDGRRVNKLRQLGTWELGGTPVGTTVAAHRYRGLGEIEQKLSADSEGAVAEAWSTTEVIPGAVSGVPLISPVVPQSVAVNDRGYALAHRSGAWISKMARGGGSPLIDFQYRPEGALAVFFERQGNLRALTEVMPGDRAISQTDEQYFALTSKHETIPQSFLVLATKEDPLTVHESRTRWKEVDQYVRDQVSEELGFVQHEVQPGVGKLYDYGWAGYYTGLADKLVKSLADQGVKFIAIHNPGWVNGRYRGPKGDAATHPQLGGGVCDIYDYVPTPDVKGPWQALYNACQEHEVAYLPWIGQTTWRYGPLVQRLGEDPRHWSLNGPHDAHGPGYGRTAMKGNIYDPEFVEHYVGLLDEVRNTYGYHGFWVDSFQNLSMSQLNWASDDAATLGTSMQRGWWKQIAKWTREQVIWMGESHSAPGLSCSIEAQNIWDDHWFMTHTWKWLRGTSQKNWTQEMWDDRAFKFMAAKAWIAPDCSYNRSIPEKFGTFAIYAKQYSAALETMRRPYILPDGEGVLWLHYTDDHAGVLFPFEDLSVPEGVSATTVLTEKTRSGKDTEISRRTVYRVTGEDLLERFSIRHGPLKDPRLGREYATPELNFSHRAGR